MLPKLFTSIVLLATLPFAPAAPALKKYPPEVRIGEFTWSRKANLNEVPEYCKPDLKGKPKTHAYVDLWESKYIPNHTQRVLSSTNQSVADLEDRDIPGRSCVNFVDGKRGKNDRPWDLADISDLQQVLLKHTNKTVGDAKTVCDGSWNARFDDFMPYNKTPKALISLWIELLETMKVQDLMKSTVNIDHVVFHWQIPEDSEEIVVDRV